MSQNYNSNGFDKNNLFSVLYRTRIKLFKSDIVIINLSLIFSVFALLVAPWLVIIGAVVALVLGYRFSLERNATGFSASFGNVVKGATDNVKSAVGGFSHGSDDAQSETRNDEYPQQ